MFIRSSASRQGLNPEPAVFEQHIADLSDKLDVYDKILSKQKYLLGDVILSGRHMDLLYNSFCFSRKLRSSTFTTSL
jgi:glutathionyl-hydroquinone reductase